MEILELSSIEAKNIRNDFNYHNTVGSSQKNPSTSPLSGLEISLNAIIPTYEEENKLTKSRSLLGSISKELSNDELEIVTAQFEYLANCWLDQYERTVFQGKTLGELMK